MSKLLFNFLLIVSIIVIFVISAIMCSFILENLILPSNWLFYEQGPISSMLFAPLLVIPSVVISYYLISKLAGHVVSAEDKYIEMISSLKLSRTIKIIIAIVWLISLYICMTTLTYVTEKEIVVLKPYDLYGQRFAYSDVDRIETGFGTKKIAVLEHNKRGNFYYKIFLDDNTVVFHVPSVNPDIERYDDSYVELEEFDQALETFDIQKISSREGYEYCDYDQRYVDRFLRIIG